MVDEEVWSVRAADGAADAGDGEAGWGQGGWGLQPTRGRPNLLGDQTPIVLVASGQVVGGDEGGHGAADGVAHCGARARHEGAAWHQTGHRRDLTAGGVAGIVGDVEEQTVEQVETLRLVDNLHPDTALQSAALYTKINIDDIQIGF